MKKQTLKKISKQKIHLLSELQKQYIKGEAGVSIHLLGQNLSSQLRPKTADEKYFLIALNEEL
jgi:hypothetical protein